MLMVCFAPEASMMTEEASAVSLGASPSCMTVAETLELPDEKTISPLRCEVVWFLSAVTIIVLLPLPEVGEQEIHSMFVDVCHSAVE
jgi:hypothetical protein